MTVFRFVKLALLWVLWPAIAYVSTGLVLIFIVDHIGIDRAQVGDVVPIGLGIASAITALILVGRVQFARDSNSAEYRRARKHLVVAIAGVSLILVGAVVTVASNEQARVKKPESPEEAAAREKLSEILSQPILRSLNVSRDQVVKALQIDTPLKRNGTEEIFGEPTLIGFNQRHRIELTVNGPQDNLRSLTVATVMENGTIDVGQVSHQIVRDFVVQTAGSAAWDWIADRVQSSHANNEANLRTTKTFGSKVLTLSAGPAGASGPAVFSFLMLPGS